MEFSPLDVSLSTRGSVAPLDPSRYIWTPVTIFNCGERFQTTYETLTKYPESQLSRVFSPPYPFFDEHNQAHILPDTLCPDAQIFSCILEFLRTDQWLMPQDAELFEAVRALANEFQLPSGPPQLFGSVSSIYRYEHQTVQLPVPIQGTTAKKVPEPFATGSLSGQASRTPTPPKRGLTGARLSPSQSMTTSQSPNRKTEQPPPYDPTTNTAAMLTILGYKGFTVVTEQKGYSKFTTEVTLRRKLPDTKAIELIAEDSPLFRRLLNIV